jgi:hypothetical protein
MGVRERYCDRGTNGDVVRVAAVRLRHPQHVMFVSGREIHGRHPRTPFSVGGAKHKIDILREEPRHHWPRADLYCSFVSVNTVPVQSTLHQLSVSRRAGKRRTPLARNKANPAARIGTKALCPVSQHHRTVTQLHHSPSETKASIMTIAV